MSRIIIMHEIKRKMKLTKLQHSDAIKKKLAEFAKHNCQL